MWILPENGVYIYVAMYFYFLFFADPPNSVSSIMQPNVPSMPQPSQKIAHHGAPGWNDPPPVMFEKPVPLPQQVSQIKPSFCNIEIMKLFRQCISKYMFSTCTFLCLGFQ